MKFEQTNKGHGFESERPQRLLSNSPDQPWDKTEPIAMPGTSQDVWKRYTESRLQTFGTR